MAVVVVNWNSRDFLLRCLAALDRRTDPERAEVVVVDNHSADGSADAVRGRYPAIRLIQNDRNVGYARATNQALASTRAPYALLLNPDAEVERDAVDRLAAELELNPALGAVTARLVGDDAMEHYVQSFPDAASVLLVHTFLGRLLPRWRERARHRYLMLDADVATMDRIPQPAGACLMVRRSVAGEPLLDEQFPLFFNDTDLCRRIWDSGHAIALVSDAVVRHTRNSAALAVDNPLLTIEHGVAMIRYFRKHGTRPEYLAVRAGVTLHHLLRYARSSAVFVGRVPRWSHGPSRRAWRKGIPLLVCCRSFFEVGDPRWQ